MQFFPKTFPTKLDVLMPSYLLLYLMTIAKLQSTFKFLLINSTNLKYYLKIKLL